MRKVEVTTPATARRPTIWQQANRLAALQAFALVACLLGAPIGSAQEGGENDPTSGDTVHYDSSRDRLSVAVTDQSMVYLFERISAETGIALVVHGAEHGVITAKFDDLPLEMGIRRLLEGRNYAIFRNSDGNENMKVWILSRSGVATITPQARLGTAANRSSSRSVQQSTEALNGAGEELKMREDYSRQDLVDVIEKAAAEMPR